MMRPLHFFQGIIAMLRIGCIALVLSIGLLSGCGTQGTSGPPPENSDHLDQAILSEVGEMLRLYKADTKGKAATGAANLAKYEPGLPSGYAGVKSGSIVVFWGSPLAEEGTSDKIIAYAKQAPGAGGYVLMQDGITVKRMTAEEFKSAPKAGEAK